MLLAMLFIGAGCTPAAPTGPSRTAATPGGPPAAGTTATASPAPTAAAPQPAVPNPAVPRPDAIAPPLPDAARRVTKKPFGIFITPETSPVTPERFRGYHTGVDFETTSAEQDTDVPVSAICDGKLAMKKRAAGYGGVAVESCVLDGVPVTVIYGHVRLSSVTAREGDTLAAGRPFAVLGTGYGSETDGERKHLHLGIHKGTGIVILGYVQKKTDLDAWLDAASLLP